MHIPLPTVMTIDKSDLSLNTQFLDLTSNLTALQINFMKTAPKHIPLYLMDEILGESVTRAAFKSLGSLNFERLRVARFAYYLVYSVVASHTRPYAFSILNNNCAYFANENLAKIIPLLDEFKQGLDKGKINTFKLPNHNTLRYCPFTNFCLALDNVEKEPDIIYWLLHNVVELTSWIRVDEIEQLTSSLLSSHYDRKSFFDNLQEMHKAAMNKSIKRQFKELLLGTWDYHSVTEELTVDKLNF